jgi:hypothetical protein
MPATGGLIIDDPGDHGSTLGLLLSASLLLRRFNHGLLALPLITTHHINLNEPVTAAREGAAMRSRGCPGDGTRQHRTAVAATDGAATAQDDKEVRRRLRDAVVLENAGWSSMEVERRGRRGRWKMNMKEKKLNHHGYIKIRSPVNLMRQRRERRCKSRTSRRTEHRLNRR